MKYYILFLLVFCVSCGGEKISNVPQNIRNEAHAKLASHLNIPKSSLAFMHGEKRTWDNNTLGCGGEKPYAVNGVNGYTILFERDRKEYFTVRTSGDVYILCLKNKRINL